MSNDENNQPREDHFGYQPNIEKGYQPTESNLNPALPPQGGSGSLPAPPSNPPSGASEGSSGSSGTQSD